MPRSATNLIDTLEIPVMDASGEIGFVRITENTENTENIKTQLSTGSGYKIPSSSASTAKARFYIDSEDEQEASKQEVPEAALSANKLAAAAAGLVSSLEPGLSGGQKDRLVNIVLSQLKGIRNPREVREVLMRAPSLGGMGLAEAKAQEIFSKIEAKKQAITNRIKGDELESGIAEQPRHGADKNLESRKTEKETKIPNSKFQIPNSNQDSKPVEDIYELGGGALIGKGGLLTEIKPRQRYKNQADVSYKVAGESKPVGPVEEMKLVTLEDFRHLGKTAKESAKRIFQKIDLLADESLELKAQAIKAWKASPTYQGYLAIGHESMEGSSSVEEIISNKAVNDMTLEEFEAVADLNKSLQF